MSERDLAGKLRFLNRREQFWRAKRLGICLICKQQIPPGKETIIRTALLTYCPSCEAVWKQAGFEYGYMTRVGTNQYRPHRMAGRGRRLRRGHAWRNLGLHSHGMQWERMKVEKK